MVLLLKKILEPLSAFYEQPDMMEVRMKHPGEVILVRRDGSITPEQAPALTWPALVQIFTGIANFTGQRFDEYEHPNVSAVLPGDHRFECLVGSSVAHALSVTIRCKHSHKITLEDVGLNRSAISYLDHALKLQHNIVVAGSPFTGKTTLLNNLLARLPANRRVIAVEDTPELELARFWNGVSLLASRHKGQNTGQKSWSELYDHKMRSSPDNIIFGEISVDNAGPALNALNTGSKGWICTVHAESAAMVPQRFADNINSSGAPSYDVEDFMGRVVDLIIHLDIDPDGRRRVMEMWEMKAGRYVMKDGKFIMIRCIIFNTGRIHLCLEFYAFGLGFVLRVLARAPSKERFKKY